MYLRSAFLVFFYFLFPAINHAVDVVVVDSTLQTVDHDDVDCSSCDGLPSGCFVLSNASSGEVLASDVWQFFNSRGDKEVSSFLLYLDVGQSNSSNKNIEIDSLAIEIRDQNGRVISHTDLGGRRLVIAKSTVNETNPEVKLCVPLGFDFMEAFNAGSTESISFRLTSNDFESNDAMVFLASRTNLGNTTKDLIPIVGFILFWCVVFILLNRLTRPTQDQSPVLATSSGPKTGQIVSA